MIYLLEDDDSIRNLVLYTLNNSGLQAKGFELPSQFFNAVNDAPPELVLLDIMLPETDGLSVLRQLRSREDTRRIPVILLTAKSAEYDKIIGLDSGADDYVTKPFSVMELLSRIRALLRRAGDAPGTEYTEYRVGGLYVCPQKHIVQVKGEQIQLTYKEFELLCLLLKNCGMVLNRDQILQRIWGYEYDCENRTVDVHIRTLRSKLKECGELIETVRGVGYKIGER